MLQSSVLNEKGCMEYKLSKVAGSDVEFVITEHWASPEDLAAHDMSPHMQEADLITPTLRAKPAVVLQLNEV
jgi:quinol monooxygenase YgiN